MSELLPPTAVHVPNWIRVALGEIGTIEDTRPGKSNPRVQRYHELTRAGEALDDVAWCASFVGFCLEMAGVISTKSKAAISYGGWGDVCGIDRFGCVILFGKSDPDAKGTGHVGFSLGLSGGDIFCLGGNQNQRVSIVTRKRKDVIACRWPHAVQLPTKP